MTTKRKPQNEHDIDVVLHMPIESTYYLLRNAVRATTSKTIEFEQIDDDHIEFCINHHIGKVTTHHMNGEMSRNGIWSHINATITVAPNSTMAMLTSPFTLKLTILTACFMFICILIFMGHLSVYIPPHHFLIVGAIAICISGLLVIKTIHDELLKNMHRWLKDLLKTYSRLSYTELDYKQKKLSTISDSLVIDTPLAACIDLLWHNATSNQPFDITAEDTSRIRFRTRWSHDNILIQLFGKTHHLFVDGTAYQLDEYTTQIDYEYYEVQRLGLIWRIGQKFGYAYLGLGIIVLPITLVTELFQNPFETMIFLILMSIIFQYGWMWIQLAESLKSPLYDTYVGRSLFVFDESQILKFPFSIRWLASKIVDWQDKRLVTHKTP